jgi:hypothetical protein
VTTVREDLCVRCGDAADGGRKNRWESSTPTAAILHRLHVVCALRRAVDSARFVSQLTIRTLWISALATTAHLGERNGGDSRLCDSDIPRLGLVFPRSSGARTTQGSYLRSVRELTIAGREPRTMLG